MTKLLVEDSPRLGGESRSTTRLDVEVDLGDATLWLVGPRFLGLGARLLSRSLEGQLESRGFRSLAQSTPFGQALGDMQYVHSEQPWLGL